jgi:tetratricopeptide (TPR) repeat protein
MQSLTVTARSSSTAFQGQALDAVTIAGKLAVAALLEGTVARSGGRLQVAVQLVDGRSGKVLWAERYDRPDRDLLAVQNEIADAVVTAVLPRFSASGKTAPSPPTGDPVAYDLYLLGRQKLREADDLNLRSDEVGARTLAAQAADLFRQAIASDPRFAQAHASLARAKLNLTYGRVNKSTPEAQAAALDREVLPDVERALELDPGNAEAYLVKGRVLRNTFRDGAEAAFRQAVELDPSNAQATFSLGWAMLAHGHVDERYRLVMRALELDPMDLQNHVASIMAAWIMARPDEVRSLRARMLGLLVRRRCGSGRSCLLLARRSRLLRSLLGGGLGGRLGRLLLPRLRFLLRLLGGLSLGRRRLVHERHQRHVGVVAGAVRHVQDASVAARARHEARTEFAEQLVHDLGVAQSGKGTAAVRHAVGLAERDQGLDEATQLLGLRHGRADGFVPQQRRRHVAQHRGAMR